MTDTELDNLYTQLCNTMTEIGEPASPLFLARFAMLAIAEINQPAVVQRLIADARETMTGEQR